MTTHFAPDWRHAAVSLAVEGRRILLCYPTIPDAVSKANELEQFLRDRKIPFVCPHPLKAAFASGGFVWLSDLRPQTARESLKFAGLEFDEANELALRNKFVCASVWREKVR